MARLDGLNMASKEALVSRMTPCFLGYPHSVQRHTGLRLAWLDHNLTPIDRIRHCGLSSPLDSPRMGEKFPEGKGVLLPGKEKWENQLNRPSCRPKANCRENTKGPVSGLHEIYSHLCSPFITSLHTSSGQIPRDTILLLRRPLGLNSLS